MRTLLVAALLAASPFAASAEGMSYTYVEGGLIRVELDDNLSGNPGLDGGYLRGSYAIADNVYLFGGYSSASETERFGPARLKYELDQPELGIGYHQEITGRMDFTADLAWMRLNEEVRISGTGDAQLDGTYRGHVSAGRVTAGLRGKPSNRTELWLKGGAVDGSDMDVSFVGNLGGQINFTKTWGLVAEMEVIEDVTRYNFGVRASF